MKRNIFTLLLLVLLSTLQLIAGPVSRSQAQKAAEAFLQKRGLSVLPTQGPAKAKTYQSGNTETPAYYIFNADDNAGFVLVSGDDRTTPILGYTTKGVYDESELPDNFKAWMESYVEQIKSLGEDTRTSVAPMRVQSTPYDPSWDAVEPLLSTTWNQNAPYNTLSPVVNGVKTVTGCVATALAQVMCYHRWPEEATTAIPAYTQGNYNYYHPELSPAVFEWDNMPLSHGEPDVNNAVATLMRYVGQAVYMNYGPESGASSPMCAPALVNYFDYDANLYWSPRATYTNGEWHSKVYEELANNRPIYYSGTTTDSGHAFVCDGYDGNGLYHINWGWGGYCDGYFVLEILNPNGSGIGGGAVGEGYSFGQGALFGVQPNTGSPLPPNYLLGTYLGVEGTTISTDFWNNSISSDSFRFGLGYEQNDGTYYPIELYNVRELPVGAGWNSWDFTVEATDFPAPGTYRVVPISKEMEGTAEWKPTMSASIYVEAIVSEDMQLTLVAHPAPALEVKNIETPSEMRRFAECTLELTVENTGEEGNSTIYMFVSQSEEKGTYQSKSASTIFMPGSTLTVPFTFAPQVAGACKLWFATDADGVNVIAQTDIEVGEAQHDIEGKFFLQNFTYGHYLAPTVSKTMIGMQNKAQRSVWEIKCVGNGCTLQNVVTGLYAKAEDGTSTPWTLSEEPVLLYCYVNDGGRERTVTFGNGDAYGKMHQDGWGNIVNWCSQIETSWYMIPYTPEMDAELLAAEEEYLVQDISNSTDPQDLADLFGIELNTSDITSLNDLIDNKVVYKLLQGKYFHFNNIAQGKNIGINAQGIPVGVNASSKDMNQIWQMVPSGSGFKFYNPNIAAADASKAYLGGMLSGAPAPAAQMCAEDNAQVYTIRVADASAGTFRFAYSGEEHDCINMEGAGYASGDYILDRWGAENSIFTALEVEEVEIDLKEASIGGAYASVYLPFDVTVEDGPATAYVGDALDANYLQMSIAKEVAAKNGFILTADAAATAVLKIGATDGATSVLTGTTVSIVLNEDNRDDNLLFGVKKVTGDETPTLGFFKPAASINSISANKAFLRNDAASAGVRILFDANTTDIDAVNAEANDAPVYDMTGRRVVRQVKGHIYIQNRKTIIAK